MKNEKIVEIFKDKEFIEKLSQCETAETKVDLLNKRGILISLSDYKRVEQIVRETKERIIAEIPDYELENVSGGVGYVSHDAQLMCEAIIKVLGLSELSND